jgi:hypothetical protein
VRIDTIEGFHLTDGILEIVQYGDPTCRRSSGLHALGLQRHPANRKVSMRPLREPDHRDGTVGSRMSTKQKGCRYVLEPFHPPVFSCSKENAVIDTSPYLLQDGEGETKFHFELATCLERARETGKTLLKGHFFYLIFGTDGTDNVHRTLSSAIKSAGGTVRPSISFLSCYAGVAPTVL